MSERASPDSGPRNMALVRVAPCLQRALYVLASGFTVSPSTDNVSFEWQETWYPFSRYSGASSSCTWVQWASSVSGVGRLSHIIRLKCLEECTSSPWEARSPQLVAPKPIPEGTGFSIWPQRSHSPLLVAEVPCHPLGLHPPHPSTNKFNSKLCSVLVSSRSYPWGPGLTETLLISALLRGQHVLRSPCSPELQSNSLYVNGLQSHRTEQYLVTWSSTGGRWVSTTPVGYMSALVGSMETSCQRM